MLGPEDTTPPAGAQTIENHVAANDQSVGLVAQEAIGLELGQNAFFDQTPGQRNRVARVFTATDLATYLLELTITQHTRVSDQAQQVVRWYVGRLGLARILHACVSAGLVSRYGGLRRVRQLSINVSQLISSAKDSRGPSPTKRKDAPPSGR